MPARFLLGASARHVFGQSLRFRNGPEACGVTSLHPLDLFFDGPESHLGATAQFIFLSSLPGFGLQVMPLLLGSMTCVFFFSLTQHRQLTFVCGLCRQSAGIDFGASRLFHRPHSLQLIFRTS